MPADADHAGVLARICGALTRGDLDAARDVARRDYPFAPTANVGRSHALAQQMRLFLRDRFTDRYTGARLVFPGTLRLLSRVMPEEVPFHPNWKVSDTHPAFWDLFPTVDHVIPVARGGRDDETNWVTTSMLRNSAKANWALDEIGWSLRPPVDDDWDGLLGFCRDYLDSHPEHLDDKYIARWYRAANLALKT
jgi:hypothetical protein